MTTQEIKAIIEKLRGWYADIYNQPAPETSSAWQPSRLDHRFALKAGSPSEQTTLIAPDFRNGDFDWYSCSAQSSAPKLSGEICTEYFTPTRVSFGGMPHPRWWAFEDARTYFGDLDVEKPDLVKLMLMEFDLVYGDDWFVIPLQVMANSLTQIVSLKAYDVFNDVVNTPSTKGLTIYPPDASKIEMSGAPWNVFRLSTRTGVLKDVLYAPPATGFREESPPLEEVRFIRDEGANMVWAIEHKVLNQLGTPIDGFDAQRERQDREEEYLEKVIRARLRNVKNAAGIDIITSEMVKDLRLTGKMGEEKIYFRLLLGLNDRGQELVENIGNVLKGVIEVEGPEIVEVNTMTPNDLGLPRYRLATSVPANWIPFVPAAIGLGVVNLQRASMLYNEADTAPQPIDAMTRVLRFDSPEEPLLSLDEEAVLRAGIKVQLTKQRVRWIDGKTYVWLGRKIVTGRGEGSSGLRFDHLQTGG